MRSPAHRRYFRRVTLSSLAYIAGVAVASRLVPDGAPATAVPIALALVPGVAIVAYLWALLRFYAELEDEYLRMLEIRKAIVATGVTLSVTAVWGLLELFTDVPRLPVFFVFPLWCLGLVVGAVANRIGFGPSGCSS